ncbi:hypothetical protein IWQ60_005653, partial [Tieghemiomyces parasiticus]
LCNGDMPPKNGCDSERIYDDVSTTVEARDGTLFSWMNTYWPSNRNDNNLFWSHEWSKHGTCVTTLAPRCYSESYEPREEVVDYFKQAQAVFSKYNLYRALEHHGITPGGEYPRAKMIEAIKQDLGVEARFQCQKGVISEVRLAFHVQGVTTYLPASPVGSHTCPEMVEYPAKLAK